MKRALILPLLILLLPCVAHAQSDWYPFAPPWNDSLRSDPSMRFFPSFARDQAGAHGFLHANPQGEFQFDDGTRTRFVGVNFSFGASMADSADIRQAAPRLAKYGVNVVRMHHMDNYNPWNARETLLDLPSTASDTRHLNPAQIRRLGFTVKTLADQGIYSNINLHVSRQFQSADGVAGADSLPDYGKAVSIFEPRIRFLMKEYARALLTSLNPSTGLHFAEDPRVAFVEITNENSLYVGWRWGALNYTPGAANRISYRHSRMLDSIWLVWLRNRYASTAALRIAWNMSTGGPIADFLRNGSFENPLGTEWQLEVHGYAGAEAAAKRLPGGVDGQYCAQVDVTKSTGTSWHVQFKQVGTFAVERDSQYTVAFRARSSHPQNISMGVMKDTANYDNLGLARNYDLTPEWQRYTASFRATAGESRHVRLTFSVGADTGSVWFDDVRLTPLNQPGLDLNESLEAGTVRRAAAAEAADITLNRLRDTGEFYISLQKDFFDDMYRFLRDSVGVRCPIAGTNWYAGLGDLSTQNGMDYVDSHAYWQHPQFPNQPWDPADWLIPNTPMTADTDLGTMPRLAALSIADKPVVISEYNHPAPSWYQGEMALHLAAYASLQDWNAVYIYAYHHGHDFWNRGFIDGFFDVDGNPVALSLFPQMADIFRRKLLQPARNLYELSFSFQDICSEAALPQGNLFFSGLSDALPLISRVRVKTFHAPLTPPAASYAAPIPAAPYESDTREIDWDPVATQLRISSPMLEGATGIIPSAPLLFGNVSITGDNVFSTILLSSVDDRPLSQSRRMLLTLVGRGGNSGMVWDGATTVHDNWGTRPSLLQAQRINCVFRGADSVRIFPLDSLGRAGLFSTFQKGGDGTIPILIDQRNQGTPWFGIERFLSPAVHVEESPIPEEFEISLYPRPAGNFVNISLKSTTGREYTLEIRTILGKLVKFARILAESEVSRFIQLKINDLTPGTYFLSVKTDSRSKPKSIPLVKF